mgnify:FL=1
MDCRQLPVGAAAGLQGKVGDYPMCGTKRTFAKRPQTSGSVLRPDKTISSDQRSADRTCVTVFFGPPVCMIWDR